MPFAFATPVTQMSQKKTKALPARPERIGEQRRDEARDADDRHPLHPVGEPAHRDGAERVEEARRRRDEHDGPVADVEGGAQLGLECLHRVQRQLVEGDQQAEDDEHEDAALGERVPEVDRIRVHPRQQVVGEDDLFLGAGLSRLPGCLLVEHGRREGGRAALGLAR